MIIRINPLDTFFFRDGKPFDMGDESWADGVFPPSPSVIYGALRTLWISEQKNGFTQENITKSEEIVIQGIYLAFNEKKQEEDNWNIHLPVPYDFVKIENTKKQNKSRSGILETYLFNSISNYEFQYWAKKEIGDDERIESHKGNALFHIDDFESYTKNKEKLSVVTNYLTSEPKIGIGRNNHTFATQEGQLYRVEMKRFGDWQFTPKRNQKKNPENMNIWVEAVLPEINEKSTFLKIGGEGKTASININNDQAKKISFPELIRHQGKTYFKICLLTPSIFEKGIFPSWIDERTHKGIFGNLSLKLLNVVNDKFLSIGGFDMRADNGRGAPKYMRKAMPAGSVYYFECEGTDESIDKKIQNKFHYQSISDYDAKQGFGISVVAKPQINF